MSKDSFLPPITQYKSVIMHSDEAEDIEERPFRAERSNTIRTTPTKGIEPSDPSNPKRFISQQQMSRVSGALAIENGPIEGRISLTSNDEERGFAKSEVSGERFFNFEGDNGSTAG